MAYNSERRSVPSYEMSPPPTRRTTGLDIENMTQWDLQHHIAELQRSIAAMKGSRGPTIPRLELSDDDHRLPPRSTSTASDRRSVSAYTAMDRAATPARTTAVEGVLPAVIVATTKDDAETVNGRERRTSSGPLDRPSGTPSSDQPCCRRSNLVRTMDRPLSKRF